MTSGKSNAIFFPDVFCGGVMWKADLMEDYEGW
jgi:hypothetical protein